MDSSALSFDAVTEPTLEPIPAFLKPTIISFYALAALFNFCLVAQALIVGLAYFDNSSWWIIHV